MATRPKCYNHIPTISNEETTHAPGPPLRNQKKLSKNLQALEVIVVDLLASAAGDTSTAASPSDTATLAPLGQVSAATGRLGGSSAGRAGGWVSGGGAIGGADISEADVGEDDLGVGALGLDRGRDTGGGSARSTGNTGGARVGISGVGAVEPEHVDRVVVPDAHDEGHTAIERSSHTGETALALEAVGVAEDGLLLGAEVGADGVGLGDAGNVGLGVLDNNAVLDVQAADLGERTGGGVVGGDELGDDGDLGVGVDGLAGSVERLVTETVRVEIASVLVADTVVPVGTITTFDAVAASLANSAARMRSIGGRDRVGFPDVHLSTAGSVTTLAGVGVVGGSSPPENVGLQTKVSKEHKLPKGKINWAITSPLMNLIS